MLEQIPNSRLGLLCRATTHQQIMQLCADYSLANNEATLIILDAVTPADYFSVGIYERPAVFFRPPPALLQHRAKLLPDRFYHSFHIPIWILIIPKKSCENYL